ncbi:Imm58 family immunity protein [Polaromonas sp.]|uniref:Imm58 family immunity protein n=1 Tax=Polaromonas sp. TaxID=1869339 RepID=UPI003266E14C
MSSVNRWKIAAALLGVCCIALIYRVFDQGITRTYLDASQETSVQHIKLLTGLVGHEWLGLPEEQVMSRLKAYAASQPPGSIVLKREPETNAIYLEGVRFEFRNGKLVNVT